MNHIKVEVDGWVIDLFVEGDDDEHLTVAVSRSETDQVVADTSVGELHPEIFSEFEWEFIDG